MKTAELERALYLHLSGTGKYLTFEMEVPVKFHRWEHQKYWLGGYNSGGERVDACMYHLGKWYFYELKVSVNDFHSSAKLSFQGNYNYFVLPEEIYEKVKDEIAEKYKGIGVLVARSYGIECVIKPKKQELQVNEDDLQTAFVRSMNSFAQKQWSKSYFMIDKIKNIVSIMEKEIDWFVLDVFKSYLSKEFKIDFKEKL